MGKLAKQMNPEIDALERGDAFVTDSPLGDRGEARPPARANGRILLRLSRKEHERLVREAAAQGVSLNHYLTEIVCGRERPHPSRSKPRMRPSRRAPVRRHAKRH
jgi:hypothetical protein